MKRHEYMVNDLGTNLGYQIGYQIEQQLDAEIWPRFRDHLRYQLGGNLMEELYQQIKDLR
jgi:hypothetical protein